MSKNSSTGSYWIDLLRGNNWMPWKCRMLAVLRDQSLEKYVEKDAGIPKASEEPTNEENDAIQK